MVVFMRQLSDNMPPMPGALPAIGTVSNLLTIFRIHENFIFFRRLNDNYNSIFGNDSFLSQVASKRGKGGQKYAKMGQYDHLQL